MGGPWARPGNPQFPFPRFGRETRRESPNPDSAGVGKQGIPDSRFGRESGIGVPIRRAGGFLVCVTRSKLARKRRPGPPELKPPRGGLLRIDRPQLAAQRAALAGDLLAAGPLSGAFIAWVSPKKP